MSGMKAPVLCVEDHAVNGAERPAFADDAGANPVLGMSAAERAAADAKRLPGDALNLYRGGDVTSAGNRDFVRSFAQHVVPDGEHAQFMTDDGTLSTEGATEFVMLLRNTPMATMILCRRWRNRLTRILEHSAERCRMRLGQWPPAERD